MNHSFWRAVMPGFTVHAQAPSPAREAASAYPARPIRIIVPGAAGGPGGTIAQVVGAKLAERWKQQVSYDFMNPINAGLRAAKNAVPDGYTLVMGGGSFLINSCIYRNVEFDPLRDFCPLSLIASVANVVVVPPSLGVTTLRELVDLAKKQPGALKYGSSGHGGPPHLMAELFNKCAGIQMGHVAYKGHVVAGHALTEGREIQVMFDAVLTAIPHIKAGEVLPLAVTTATRTKALPDVPTIMECGVPDYELSPAMGILAPAGTPSDLVHKISSEIVQIMRLPEVVADLHSKGMEPIGNTAAEFATHIGAATRKWAKVVSDAGIAIADEPPPGG